MMILRTPRTGSTSTYRSAVRGVPETSGSARHSSSENAVGNGSAVGVVRTNGPARWRTGRAEAVDVDDLRPALDGEVRGRLRHPRPHHPVAPRSRR